MKLYCTEHDGFLLVRSVLCADSDRVPSTEVPGQSVMSLENCITSCYESAMCTTMSFSAESKCRLRKSTCKPNEVDGIGITMDKIPFISDYIAGMDVFQSSTENPYIPSLSNDGEVMKTDFLKHGLCSMTMRETNPWWSVDLKIANEVASVLIILRSDCCRKFQI